MLFQSCRVIFEHLFSLQRLPEDHGALTEFDIPSLNQYINEHKDLVYIFYTKIIDVELPRFDASQTDKRPNLTPLQKVDSNRSSTEILDIEQDKECLKYQI